MKVPFVNLSGQHQHLRAEIMKTFEEVLDKSAFIGGPNVPAFEEELASFMTRKHAKGVASCTAALTMTLKALGLEPGDEVITTVLTAIPTAEAITLAGGRCVFADIDPETFQIDVESVTERIGPATRVLLPVHLYGLAAPVDRMVELADSRGLKLIEDAAQAQGARLHGRRLGSYGSAGCLSFFPSKNLGAFGDGGAMVTDDQGIDRFVRMYSNHGRLEKFTHEIEGANERLDGLQAAILRVKLRHLDEWNGRRRQVAAWYEEALSDIPQVRLPRPIPGAEPIWHLYVVRAQSRDSLREHLGADGVATGLHYPLPLHMQPAYGWMGLGAGAFPAAEEACTEILSLPMDPFLTQDEVGRVADSIRRFYAHPHA